MESDLYKDVLEVNKYIYSSYSHEYFERTRNGHGNYLQEFIDLFINNLSGKVVYDLGCGPGRDLDYFCKKGLNAVGVDCSSGMIDICKNRGLSVIKNDYFTVEFDNNSIDGIWAYTSHTVIPKIDFCLLLAKYQAALKKDTGILALGMIEGDFEGWKQDEKYDGTRRFVSRYSIEELERILSGFFGTVSAWRVIVGNKTYIHCLCKNTAVANNENTVVAAKRLFNRFSNQYLKNTQTGIELLDEDRRSFISLLKATVEIPKVLDIGCGPGRDLVQMKILGAEVLGLDISESNVNNCRMQGVDAIVGDIYRLEDYFNNSTFDGAWCNCSVTNWILRENLLKVFEMIKNIVKPGGYIFMGSVLGNLIGWEIDLKYDKMRRYNNHWNEAELRRYLSHIGPIVYERKLLKTGKKDYFNAVLINE